MTTERAEPRISLNKLTEYLTTNAASRRRIVTQQKYPKDFLVIYYQFASETITRFLANGANDESLLTNEIARLASIEPKSDYEEYRLPSNMEAIESFLNFYDKLNFEGLTATEGQSSQPRLNYDGVSISVRPEIILTGNLQRNSQAVGAVKFYFTKNEQLFLNAVTAQYPTSILCEFLATHHPPAKPINRLCFVVDIFGQSIHTAPRSYRRSLSDIKAACQEIKLWWPSL